MSFSPELRPDLLCFHARSPEGDPWVRAARAADRVTGAYGIVSRCRHLPRSDRLPSVAVCVAQGPRRGFNGWNPANELVGMGVAEDPDEARLKAVAEAVERYCFAFPHDPTSVVRAALDEVDEIAVATRCFATFSEEQYRAEPSLRLPGPDEPIDWTWAYSLTRQRFALVPAALAYPSVGLNPPNHFTRWVMSTGVATHTSVEAAALAGLLEVVERDAIMVHWLNRHSPPRVAVDDGGCPELAELLRERFALDDVEFVLLALETDVGLPTVACIALGDGADRPSAMMGAATRLDPFEACRKALFETAQLLAALHNLQWLAGSRFPEADVRTLWDHAHFYAGAHSRSHLDFLTASPQRVNVAALAQAPALGPGAGRPAGPSEWLDRCVGRLAGLGLEVLVVDLTPPDVGRAGFRTVKVLVPGAVDINGDTRFPPLGAARTRTVPRALGWTPVDRLNPAPCPMT